jgi:hypothetical protein
MLRQFLLAIFVIPKVVVWPLLYYWRRRRKQCIEEEAKQLQDDVSSCPEPDPSA